MSRNELIRQVTTEQLDVRANEIAQRIGVTSAKEAFALLDEGELDGTWAEVQLKLVRHLRGEEPTSLPPIAAE